MELDYYLVEDAANEINISPRYIYNLGAAGEIPLFIYSKDMYWNLKGFENHFHPPGFKYNGFIRIDRKTLRDIECLGSTKLDTCHIDNPTPDLLAQIAVHAEELLHEAKGGTNELESLTIVPNSECHVGHSNLYHREFNVFIFKTDLVKVVRKNTPLPQHIKQENVPKNSLATKSKNTYLRTIYCLSDALIGGLSGTKTKDADAILAQLDLKGITPPISSKKLSDILEEAKNLMPTTNKN